MLNVEGIEISNVFLFLRSFNSVRGTDVQNIIMIQEENEQLSEQKQKWH